MKQASTTTAAYFDENALVRKAREFPMFDGLGSVRTFANPSQTMTGTLNMDSFGNAGGQHRLQQHLPGRAVHRTAVEAARARLALACDPRGEITGNPPGAPSYVRAERP